MRFAAEGARVAAADISLELAEETAALAAGISAFGCDVGEESSIDALLDAVEAALGPLDVMVNNAGITRPAMLHKMTNEAFDDVWAVNGRGVFLALRAAARRMIERERGGSIINVTSSAALQGTIGQINYAAAKGAVTSMTKSAARELARHRIRVNAVAPIAATPMTETLRENEKLNARHLAQIPLGRFGAPEEIAEAFLYLAEPASAYVTGQVLNVDGGLVMGA